MMTTLTPDAYWKVRCLLAEARAEELAAKWAVARAAEKARLAMIAAGLDPTLTYRWHDTSATVIPMESVPHA
jgi:hypothetical protein